MSAASLIIHAHVILLLVGSIVTPFCQLLRITHSSNINKHTVQVWRKWCEMFVGGVVKYFGFLVTGGPQEVRFASERFDRVRHDARLFVDDL